MLFRRRKPEAPAQWLIVGLGNPGGEYKGTRHNVGWEVIDDLAKRHGIRLDKSRHRARLGVGLIDGVRVVLVKPLTYMNLSGQAVAPLMREAGLTPASVFVVSDDKDLAFGKLRLRLKGSAGGHNGHKSLIHSLRTDEYPRLKIGIGSGEDDAIDHVLGDFTREERVAIDAKVQAAARVVAEFLACGETAALQILEKENVGS